MHVKTKQHSQPYTKGGCGSLSGIQHTPRLLSVQLQAQELRVVYIMYKLSRFRHFWCFGGKVRRRGSSGHLGEWYRVRRIFFWTWQHNAVSPKYPNA